MAFEKDVLDIRNTLMRLVEKAPAGGIFTEAETEPTYRNEFALRPDPEGPIFTVRVTVGGAMRSTR